MELLTKIFFFLGISLSVFMSLRLIHTLLTWEPEFYFKEPNNNEAFLVSKGITQPFEISIKEALRKETSLMSNPIVTFLLVGSINISKASHFRENKRQHLYAQIIFFVDIAQNFSLAKIFGALTLLFGTVFHWILDLLSYIPNRIPLKQKYIHYIREFFISLDLENDGSRIEKELSQLKNILVIILLALATYFIRATHIPKNIKTLTAGHIIYLISEQNSSSIKIFGAMTVLIGSWHQWWITRFTSLIRKN